MAPEGSGLIQSLQVLDGGRTPWAPWPWAWRREPTSRLSLRHAAKQFGKAISEFQATQIKLADMATQIDAARLLVTGPPGSRTGKGRFTKGASMAKLFASELRGARGRSR